LEEHSKKLQETVKELEEKNYYLRKESRVLRGLVGEYQDQIRILKDFTLMMFILRQLVVKLYLLSLFNGNNACVTIF